MFLELIIFGTAGVGLALSDNLTLFWVFAAIYIVGEVLNGPAQSVLLTENIDSEIRGEIMGLDATMDQLLAVLSPFAAGFLIILMGPQMTLFAFMLLYWVSLAFAIMLYLKHNKFKRS